MESDVTTDDMEVVSELRAALAERVGPERFELWFGPNTRLAFDGQTLAVGVPNRFFVEWIRSNFRRHIEGACADVLERPAGLKFHVDSTLPDPHVESAAPTQTKSAERRPVSATSDGKVRQSPSQPSTPSPGGSQRRKFASFESFVSGPTNDLAVASAKMVARRPGEINPLLICGPTSVGKTHLLEGTFRASRRWHRQSTVIYLTAEQFTSDFLEALRGSGLPLFRRKYRSVGMLIFDDLQFLAGKRATQVELLHTVDTLLRDGRQLVFSADRSPGELAELVPELTTRLQGGMVCPIEPPDYATRLRIVEKMAGGRGITVPTEVQQFIASRLTNHVRELAGALCRLQAFSKALSRSITLPLAEEALAEMVRHSARPVRLPDIEKAVCHVFGLEPSSLQSGDKAKRVSHPRMLAMWLARKHTRAALSEIGQYFGRRSHSTVISAQKRVDGWMAGGESLRLAEGTWDVDEAIRQVERQLRAG